MFLSNTTSMLSKTNSFSASVSQSFNDLDLLISPAKTQPITIVE